MLIEDGVGGICVGIGVAVGVARGSGKSSAIVGEGVGDVDAAVGVKTGVASGTAVGLGTEEGDAEGWGTVVEARSVVAGTSTAGESARVDSASRVGEALSPSPQAAKKRIREKATTVDQRENDLTLILAMKTIDIALNYPYGDLSNNSIIVAHSI